MRGEEAKGYTRGTLNLLAQKTKATPLPYKIIWQSSAIPHRPHVVKKSLAAEAKALLRKALTQMVTSNQVAYDAVEPVFSGGFTIAQHAQFQPIIDYVSDLVPNPDTSKPDQANDAPKSAKQ